MFAQSSLWCECCISEQRRSAITAYLPLLFKEKMSCWMLVTPVSTVMFHSIILMCLINWRLQAATGTRQIEVFRRGCNALQLFDNRCELRIRELGVWGWSGANDLHTRPCCEAWHRTLTFRLSKLLALLDSHHPWLPWILNDQLNMHLSICFNVSLQPVGW